MNPIERTFKVNTIAMFWTTKAFLPKMLENNHGHIVTIASSAGIIGVNGLADYCASKFGAVGFDESLRFELRKLGKTGVHTTCICPYYINTGMFDGVKSKFPILLPVLEQNDATRQIMNAVKRNQPILIMPDFASKVPLARALLPLQLFDPLMEFFGVSNTMDEFKGRGHDSGRH